jgi:cellulose synthase/poly-beta-1,6-N-acetylglucosamine synthase-like glycosyltransferase
LDDFIKGNAWLLENFPVIVIDSGGGEKLRKYALEYVQKNIDFWDARRLAYQMVKTPYVMNLDSDVIIPNGYLANALDVLKNPDVGAVSLFYEGMTHFGVLEYGVSIWKTSLVKQLYDFDAKKLPPNGLCECIYMFRKLWNSGYRVEIVSPFFAKHLRGSTNPHPKSVK